MNPLDNLSEEVAHLLHTLAGEEFWGPFTTYTPFILIAALVVLMIFMVAKKQLALIPTKRVIGIIEFIIDFVQNQIATNLLGASTRQHLPFLVTLFVFILVSNIVGLIPGFKSPTGVMGSTVGLAVISFCYFNYSGIKAHGLRHYLGSFAPKGVPAPIAALIWLLEFVSSCMRLLTLSIRLFANMFAGHILLGVLAILTSLSIAPLIESINGASVGFASMSVLWVFLLVILYAMEFFVAALQAFVFTLLSTVYIMLATTEH